MQSIVASTLPRRTTGGFVVAAVAHAMLLVVLVALARVDRPPIFEEKCDCVSQALIWRSPSGDAGGGGSGGNHRSEPIRRLTRAGDAHESAPSATPTPITPQPTVAPETTPPDPIQISVKPIGEALDSVPGHIGSAVTDGTSRGPGSGPGAGGSNGAGDGDGNGDGVGSGNKGGCCERAYKEGNGVTRPTVRPNLWPRRRSDSRGRAMAVQAGHTFRRTGSGDCSDRTGVLRPLIPILQILNSSDPQILKSARGYHSSH